ncbi:MAG: Asp-tRNA(Asn)/Glu-tRNA(Gln) amidotransferase subunit GatB [Algoriphagus sp.]|nr:Asp-tRNA(Asn)/Glu-tRNA(Gln) amidotransferase subunit GatB [Algoriphagus sp.]
MLTQELTDKYQLVVGLEVHAQLATSSKLFAGDATNFGAQANTQVSVITLGHPGTLPKLNIRALEFAVRMGLACESQISRKSSFDRKNYFYPDLPKGYQITQDKEPICVGGNVILTLEEGTEREIVLNRIHLEEDAGKLIHSSEQEESRVDYNRAGTALIELVTEPCLRSAEEAVAFLAEIRKLVMYLGICDGNMEEGSLRCDANVSVRLHGSATLGKKVEIKNMNSFRNLGRAIDFEYERQVGLLEVGQDIVSETRTFDADRGVTASMRTKEELNDYRYFPEPDLPPVILTEEWIEKVRAELPVLPRDLYRKFREVYGLPRYDAALLTETKEASSWFESLCTRTAHFKAASNWMMGPLKSYLNESGITYSNLPLSVESVAQLIALVEDGKISFSVASQKIFPELLLHADVSPLSIAQRLNLIQESDASFLLPMAKEVLFENPGKVSEYKSGKKGLLGFFMGELMKKSKGKADPKVATQVITDLLMN